MDALIESNIMDSVLSLSDVDAAAEALTEGLRYLYDMFFPLRTIRIRDDDKPWVKPSLKLLINARDRAYSENKQLKYIRLRESVIRHVQKLKNDYLYSNSGTSNSSTNWRAINEILHRKKKPASPDVNELSQVFADTFVSSNLESICEQVDSMARSSNSFLNVTQQEVYDVLLNLKKGSAGPDDLPFWILRDYAAFLSPAIHHVINLSLTSGKVPRYWKMANITPIPKTDRPELTDYRPISLLPIISKVIEKLVRKKVALSKYHTDGLLAVRILTENWTRY